MTKFIGSTDCMNGSTFQSMVMDDPPRAWKMMLRGWDYQRRTVKTRRDRQSWKSKWPRGSFLSGDASTPLTLAGNCAESGMVQYAWSVYGRGGHQLKFISGQCVDSGGTAVPGAVVQGFRTSDDLFVRETACDDKGNYELGTEYPGVAHFLVAYLDTATDLAGTTVNTLVPTNRDGT